jgi:hypothetical protein
MLQALKLESRISKGIVSLDHVRNPAKFVISGEHTYMHECISVNNNHIKKCFKPN